MLLAIFAFLFSVSVEKANSCPPGYGSYTTSAIYTYNVTPTTVFTCNVTIFYCCKWDNNQKKLDIEIDGWEETYGGHCIAAIPNYADFINWLHGKVSIAAEFSCTPVYPPCDDSGISYFETTVMSKSCYYYENYQPYIGDDYHFRTQLCSNGVGECVSKWKVCLDYNFNPAQIRREFVSRTQYNSPNCSYTMPILPADGSYLWETSWTTNCFSLPCN